jgi:hypothetical protein
MNDGNVTGLKQDRFRNSEFEYERWRDVGTEAPRGMARATLNTLGGVSAENRGRRGDEDWEDPREDNPFENGELHNWNRRQGWDDFFDGKRRERRDAGRGRGGDLLGFDSGGAFAGVGPKGYKRPDQRIFDDVCETLSLSPDVDASAIDVSVKDGVVYLQGSVEDRRMKRMAEYEIENISGVADVQNLLSLGTATAPKAEAGQRPDLS